MVHELIVGKASINVITSDGVGPLHLAARKGYNDIVLELLDAGAAPDMQDKVCVVLFTECNDSFLSCIAWQYSSS